MKKNLKIIHSKFIFNSWQEQKLTNTAKTDVGIIQMSTIFLICVYKNLVVLICTTKKT